MYANPVCSAGSCEIWNTLNLRSCSELAEEALHFVLGDLLLNGSLKRK